MEQNVRLACIPTTKNFYRQLWIVTLSLLLTVTSVAQTAQISNLPLLSSAEMQIGLAEDQSKPLVKIDVQVQEVDGTPSALKKLAKQVAVETQKNQSTVVLSTDSSELLEESIQQQELVTGHLTVVAIPKERNQESNSPDTELKKNSNFTQLIHQYTKSAVQSVKNDKIGFLILTYTTATESLTWIHSTHMTQFEKTSSVVYTVGLALVFGLNKDSWAHATRPIQQFFRNKLNSDVNKPASTPEFITRFLGNVSLAALVTTLRIPLMSMDHIIQTGVQLHYFTIPLLMTVVSTAAIFTWSENLAMIDEQVMPVTKFVFRRVSELRSIIIGTFATAAALLNPSQYGSRPWLVLAAVGTTGVLIYFNAARIHQWIENQPWLQKIKINNLNKNLSIEALQLQCHLLFN